MFGCIQDTLVVVVNNLQLMYVCMYLIQPLRIAIHVFLAIYCHVIFVNL